MSERHRFRNTAHIERIIAISDIHGDGLLLRRLIARLAPGADDLVVLIGDYINRGPDSDDALHTVMQLAKRENVIVLKGNMDRLIDWYFWRGSADLVFGHFREYQACHFGILFFEWARKCGYETVTPDNFGEIRSVLAKRYEAEGQFVRDLPFGLETDSHLFVHAGVCASADWRDRNWCQQSRLISSAYSLRQSGMRFLSVSSGTKSSSMPEKSTPVPLRRSISTAAVRMCLTCALAMQCRILRLPTVQSAPAFPEIPLPLPLKNHSVSNDQW